MTINGAVFKRVSLACMKAITGHLEHGPLGEQQLGPCGLNELLSVTGLPPTWPISASTLVSLPPTSQPATLVQLPQVAGLAVCRRKWRMQRRVFQFGAKWLHKGKNYQKCICYKNWKMIKLTFVLLINCAVIEWNSRKSKNLICTRRGSLSFVIKGCASHSCHGWLW